MENVVYKFVSESSVPCKMIAKRMLEIQEEYKDILPFVEVSISDEKNKYLIDKFGVLTIPTVVVICDGYEIERFTGTSIPKLLSKTLREEFLTEYN